MAEAVQRASGFALVLGVVENVVLDRSPELDDVTFVVVPAFPEVLDDALREDLRRELPPLRGALDLLTPVVRVDAAFGFVAAAGEESEHVLFASEVERLEVAGDDEVAGPGDQIPAVEARAGLAESEVPVQLVVPEDRHFVLGDRQVELSLGVRQ